MDVQQFRHQRLLSPVNDIGVYALCALGQIPIYVGQSTDGIRSRVRRHLTNARSDIIANRQVDVWAIAFVWAWSVPDESLINSVEAALFYRFDCRPRSTNGTVPQQPNSQVAIPGHSSLQVLSDEEVTRRKEPRYRFPWQSQQVALSLDHILET